MPWNGSGQYVLPPAFTPEENGTVIDAVRYNGTTDDIANGITDSLAKNGENVPTADLPMAGFRHTGVGDALAFDQYATLGQVLAFNPITQSNRVTLFDDAASSFVMDNGTTGQNINFVALWVTDESLCVGVSWHRVRKSTAGGSALQIVGNANFEVITTPGTLTGTTGTDGKFVVRSGEDGRLYFENRVGFTTGVTVSVFGLEQFT